MMMTKIDHKTQTLIFKAICADPEIRDLMIRGAKHSPPQDEPVYEPDKRYSSPEILSALQKAKTIAKSIAPEVDTGTIDFANVFLKARLTITEHLGQ